MSQVSQKVSQKVSPNVWVIVPAAGVGKRFGGDTPKQYLPLGDSTVLHTTLHAVTQHHAITGVMVAVSAQDEYWQAPVLDVPVFTAPGGAERVDSVRQAMAALAGLSNEAVTCGPDDWVLVHDAARPCLHSDDLARLLEQLCDDDVGGLLAAPVADTLKKSQAGRVAHVVAHTVDRSDIWRALTPQMFRFEVLQQALSASGVFTDEASAVEALGLQPRLIPGRADNLKITHPEDLPLAAAILQLHKEALIESGAHKIA